MNKYLTIFICLKSLCFPDEATYSYGGEAVRYTENHLGVPRKYSGVLNLMLRNVKSKLLARGHAQLQLGPYLRPVCWEPGTARMHMYTAASREDALCRGPGSDHPCGFLTPGIDVPAVMMLLEKRGPMFRLDSLPVTQNLVRDFLNNFKKSY